MKISELVKALEDIKSYRGDIEVRIWDFGTAAPEPVNQIENRSVGVVLLHVKEDLPTQIEGETV